MSSRLTVLRVAVGEYAAYVEGFDNYLYTKKWVEHLKTVMADKALIETIKKA